MLMCFYRWGLILTVIHFLFCKKVSSHRNCWEMLKVAKAREEVARLNGIRVTCS